jgi:negative regulator of flagellin synthesis FlgM
MSDIAPVNGGWLDRIEPAGGLRPGAPRPAPERAEGHIRPDARPSDQIDISDRARLLARLASLPPIREDLIARVRAQIEDGTYESDEKLEQAIEALARDLDPES